MRGDSRLHIADALLTVLAGEVAHIGVAVGVTTLIAVNVDARLGDPLSRLSLFGVTANNGGLVVRLLDAGVLNAKTDLRQLVSYI